MLAHEQLHIPEGVPTDPVAYVEVLFRFAQELGATIAAVSFEDEAGKLQQAALIGTIDELSDARTKVADADRWTGLCVLGGLIMDAVGPEELGPVARSMWLTDVRYALKTLRQQVSRPSTTVRRLDDDDPAIAHYMWLMRSRMM